MSKIEETVIKKIRSRAELGKNKYGTTMERGDLSLYQWLQHLQDELMDAAVYTQKLMEEFRDATEEALIDRYDKETVLDKYQIDLEDEIRERRMEIIGRNGNDGLHYESTATLNINGATVTYGPCSAHAFEDGD